MKLPCTISRGCRRPALGFAGTLLFAATLQACGSDGEVAAPCGAVSQSCCAAPATACSDGLGCSSGACAALPFADGAGCSDGASCASGVCGTDARCAVANCSDGVRNGGEGDVDCGGACALRCALGQSCGGDGDCARGTCFGGACGFEPGGLLGKGGGSDTVAWTNIAGQGDGLWAPADLAFNLDHPEQLWIVDRDRDALLVARKPGSAETTKKLILDISQHFLEEVVAISFDGAGTFGTCGDSKNAYGGMRAPNDFMGPAQWPSDLEHFPDKVSAHEQHWDMLHSTPNCMGIAAAGPDQYFCFNGHLGCIDWYDFHEPHVPGGDDHSDGEKRRYADAAVKLARVAGVPSNLVWDAKAELLYIADTGNGRLVRLDPKGAQVGKFIVSFPLDGKMNAMTGFVMQPFVEGVLTQPSGLALHEDTLYVADRGSGQLHAFDLQGKHLRALDSGIGKDRLGGLTAGPDDRLYLVDIEGKRVMRVETSW